MIFIMGAWFYDVVIGLFPDTYEPPTKWLSPAHAKQPTILQKPGALSSFLISHKVYPARDAP